MGCTSSTTKFYQFGLNGALFYQPEAQEFISHINTIPIPNTSIFKNSQEKENLKKKLELFYNLFDEWQSRISEIYISAKKQFSSDLKSRDTKLFIMGQSVLFMLCLFSGSKEKFYEIQDFLKKNVQHGIFVKPLFQKGRLVIEYIFNFSRHLFLENSQIFSLETMLSNLMTQLQKGLLQLEDLDVLLPLLSDNEKGFEKMVLEFMVERTGVMMVGMIYNNSSFNFHRINNSLHLIQERFVGGEYANEEKCSYMKEWIKKNPDLFWKFGKKKVNEPDPGDWMGYRAYYTRVEEAYV